MTQDTSKQQVARYNIKKNTWAIIALSLFVLDCLCVLLFNSMDAVFVLVVMTILSVAAFLSALKIKDTSKTEQLVIVENPVPPNFQGIVQGLREEEDLFDSSGKKATCESDTTKCFVMSFATNLPAESELYQGTLHTPRQRAAICGDIEGGSQQGTFQA